MKCLRDRYASEDALAGRRCRRRRQVAQIEVGDVAGADDTAEDGDAQRPTDLWWPPVWVGLRRWIVLSTPALAAWYVAGSPT